MPATKTKPKPKKDVPVIEASATDVERHGLIRTHNQDIKAFKSRLKGLVERAQKIIDGTAEGQEVDKLADQLNVARENLRRRLEGNSEYMKLTEEMADERLSIRDAERVLSDLLLANFADTRERQIELGPHEAYQVILRGRLGKPKDFQTSIFSGADTASQP